jgi:positive regulator of sigma E activity
MRESGIIQKANDRFVVVAMQPARPEQCAACGCCGDHKGGRHELRLSRTVDERLGEAREGDRVELELNLPNQAIAAMVLFGIPIGGILAGALTAHAYAPGAEGLTLAGGAGGLVLGGILVWFISSRMEAGGRGVRVVKLTRPESAD